MSLPSGYKRLEYIKSTGTQYVDTLFNPTQNTKLVLDMAFLGSAGTNVAGVRNNSRDTTNRFGIISFGSTSKLGAFFRESSIQAVRLDNNRHLCVLSKDGLVFDGTSYGGANTGSFSCTYSLTLFAWNNGANGVACNLCKVYSCQIYDNGNLVRDFVPCQTTSGDIGLWDDVNSKLYANAGTGTFTAGPVIAIAADKSEIKKLEYIQSTGTQYINTGFAPNNNTRVVLRFTWKGGRTSISGVRDNGGDGPGYLLFFNDNIYNIMFGTVYSHFSAIEQVESIVDFDGVNQTITINGSTNSFSNASFQVSKPLFLFAFSESGRPSQAGPFDLYSCQIYDNGTLIRDYIPAKLSNGTIGLYDKLNGLFYINVGTGTFEAGPNSLDLPVNIGGTWKDANEAFVNIGGTWKTVEAAFVNIGGTWKELG